MGRTNMILLGMGILACLALSLLMQRGLKMQKAAGFDPVVRAVSDVFGERLQSPPRFRVKSEGGRRVGVLQLLPLPGAVTRRLARDIGRFVWQQEPWRFDELVILLKGNVDDPGRRIPIPRPLLARKPLRQHLSKQAAKQSSKQSPHPASRPASRTVR